MNIWIVGMLIDYSSEIAGLKLNFQKINSFKTPFFVIYQLFTPHSICLKIGFWLDSLKFMLRFQSQYFQQENRTPVF